MKGLKVSKYYSDILKNYTIHQAMEDSLAFSPGSPDGKLLVMVAERVEGRLSMANRVLTCHNTADTRRNYNPDERGLFCKMVADVINNINEIRDYLRENRYKNPISYHRDLIMPGIINRDFLREGNYIKIKEHYYNIEITLFILSNEKVKKINFTKLYEFMKDNTLGTEEKPLRKSYITLKREQILKEIIPYRDLSVSKSNEEAVLLLCENTMFCELPTTIILEQKRAVKGFRYFYPMNDTYIDLKWLHSQIPKLEHSIKVKNTNRIDTEYEEKMVKLGKKILSRKYKTSIDNYDFINWFYMK